jgi:hypothetical protein
MSRGAQFGAQTLVAMKTSARESGLRHTVTNVDLVRVHLRGVDVAESRVQR